MKVEIQAILKIPEGNVAKRLKRENIRKKEDILLHAIGAIKRRRKKEIEKNMVINKLRRKIREEMVLTMMKRKKIEKIKRRKIQEEIERKMTVEMRVKIKIKKKRS